MTDLCEGGASFIGEVRLVKIVDRGIVAIRPACGWTHSRH
jgi:hypothetical protein